MYFVRRVARLGISLGVVLLASFALLQLIPGDPVRAALGATAPAAVVEQRRADLELNRPVPEQFQHYLGDVFTGDFGESLLSRQPVGDVIAGRLPATIGLVALAILLALAVAVPLGMWMAARTENGRRGSVFVGSVTGLSVVPEFLLAGVLIALFGLALKWLPVAGRDGPSSYVMPVVSLAAGPAALLARLVRVETLRELSTDYVLLARAKRMSTTRLYLRHLLPNTLAATLTTGGPRLSALLGGSVVIEYVFGWPGMGRSLVAAIADRDYPLAQAGFLVYGTLCLVLMFVVDVVRAVLDPRSTLETTG
jgi:peptide/nickel transport system permease protein